MLRSQFNIRRFRRNFRDRRFFAGGFDRLDKHLPRLRRQPRFDHQHNGFRSVRLHEKPDVWLKLSPEAIGYSGYVVENGLLKFSAMLAARIETFIGPEPAPQTASPLPPLQKGDLPSAGFRFFLPIVASYDELELALARALKFGERQQLTVPEYGNVDVTFRSAEIYQTSGRRLAIGFELDAKPEKWSRGIDGTVWITSAVSIDNELRLVSAKELSIESETDNAAFDVLVRVLNLPPVNAAIVDSLRYDFSEDYQRFVADVNSRLRFPISDDLHFVGRIDEVSVTDLGTSADALQLSAEVKGVAEVGLGPLPAAPES